MYAGMKATFKFAALVLLLVIATGTAIAAIPCQADRKKSMHCGNDCPMMAIMHQATEQSSANVSGASCCQISNLPTTPAPVQTLPERLTPVAVIAIERGVAIIPFAQKVHPKIRTNDLRSNPSAPALLCTFLI